MFNINSSIGHSVTFRLRLAALPILAFAAGALHAQTQTISLSPASLAFPVTVVGKTSTAQTVTVTSTGNTAVTFTSFAIGGTGGADFTISANTCGASLASGASCQISVTFTPAVTGSLTGNLTVTDSATNSPQVASLSGAGSNIVFTLRPTAITFPVVNVGSTSTSQVTATNIGIATATISSIAIGGGDATDFVIGTKTCGTTLAAGASCTVNATFKPTVNGIRTSNLLFTDTASQSPQSVQLTGTAEAATQTLIFTPTALVFNPTSVGTPAIASTNVENFGSATTSFTSTSLTGSNPGDFYLINSCAPLGPTASCNITVGFRPVAPGLRTAILLLSDSAVGSPQSVPLTGTGVASGALLSVSATALSFAPTNVGISENSTVNIQSLGTSGAVFSSFAISGRNASDFAITSNACPSGLGQLVAPQVCAIGITFTPAAGGIRAANLTITDSAIGSPQVIPLTGIGQTLTEQISFSESNLTFGAQTIGTNSGTSSVNLQNLGDATINFSSIVIGGSNPGDFTISSESCVPGGTLIPSGYCNIFLTFTPEAAGVRSATLTFTDNAQGSPQAVTLEGVGDTAAQQLSFNYTNVDFGVLNVGSTASQIGISVNNYGDSATTFTGIAISGTNAADFSVTSDSCLLDTSLVPSNNCSVYVIFTPSATGLRTAQLVFTDSATGSPQIVGLSGYGQTLTETVIFAYPSLVFTAQTVGTTSSQMYDYLQTTGDAPVVISSVSVTGGNAGDFAISSNGCPIGGAGLAGNGNYCYFYVTFTPSATGVRTSTLQFVDSATGSPHNVALVGVGTPAVNPLSLSPTDIAFNDQNVGTTSSSMGVSVSNPNTTALTLSVTLSGANASDFAISTNTCPGSLASGSACSINVTFKPAALGTRVAALQFTAGGTVIDVGLSGIGTTAAKVLTTQQLAVDFGPINVAATSAQSAVQVNNTGTETITFSGFTLGGANPGDFTISSATCGSTLAVGSSCNVYLTFTPTTTAVRTASLQIADDAMGSPQSVPLSGIGQAATMILSLATPYAFPATNIGASASQLGYFYNAGTANITVSNFTITGTNAGDFAVGQTGCSGGGTLLNPGGYCYVYVTFTPTAAGVRNASLQLTDNATGSPQTVAINGVGQTLVMTLVVPQAVALPIANVGQTLTNSTYFYINNTGNTTVTFSSVTISGTNNSDFALGSTSCGTTLAGNSNCYYYINFTPSAAGLRTASVKFTDNATGSPQSVTLTGVGEVSTTTLSLPAAVTVPLTTIGATNYAGYYYARNTGTASITLGSVAITGTNASEFSLQPYSDCATGLLIPPGSYCSIYVAFVPLAAGNRTAAIQFTDNAAGSPQSIPLNGVGQGVTTTASFNPSVLAFANQTVGTTSGDQLAYLTNTGDSPFTISGVSITGANSSDFVIDYTTCTVGTVMGLSGSCVVYVYFGPTATGARTATLQITDTAVGGTQSVALTGTGQ